GGIPIKLVLIDDRCGLLPLSSATDATQSAVLLHPSELLDSLSALFELIWRTARPLRTPRRPSSDPRNGNPAGYDSTILTLLANAFTDESIGRTLGCSLRTAQRHVRQLMDSLDATTRFQAGLNAGARGWL